MEAKRYIFLSAEGFTFQPNSNLEKPDIENLQVIGFAKGRDSKDAFQQLLKENSCLIDTSFDKIFSYKDRKSTRLNSSHIPLSRMPSSA